MHKPWTGDLQSFVTLRGQAALRFLIQRTSGGTTAGAARAARVSRGTLERWLEDPTGDGLLRSGWAGYPSPLPTLDLLIGASDLPYRSWLEAAEGCLGVDGVERMREAPFGLTALKSEYGKAGWLSIARAAGVPSTTALRMIPDRHTYPAQLHALDRLVAAEAALSRFEAWLEAGLPPAVAPEVLLQVQTWCSPVAIEKIAAVLPDLPVSQLPLARLLVGTLSAVETDFPRASKTLGSTSVAPRHLTPSSLSAPSWLRFAYAFDGSHMKRPPNRRALQALLIEEGVIRTVRERLAG